MVAKRSHILKQTCVTFFCDFDTESLKLIKCYLTNRLQTTKVNTSFSKWTKLLLGVPQGSALGPLLFNIYFNNLFF